MLLGLADPTGLPESQEVRGCHQALAFPAGLLPGVSEPGAGPRCDGIGPGLLGLQGLCQGES